MSAAENGEVAILGAGAFGTALALAFARGGRKVVLYGRDTSRMAAMAKSRACGDMLPGANLPPAVIPISDIEMAARADVVVIAVPTQNLRGACRDFARYARKNAVILSAAKGIEQGSGAFVTEILQSEISATHRFGVLSGPSFAADIARGLPTAISLAMADSETAGTMAGYLGSSALRLYHTGDIRGVEIGGAAKNVLAIGAGIVAGMGLGESARAAMIARGFAELRRFAEAMGARSETLMGLSGLGDLLLSASSPQSRNFAFGLALGQGKSPVEAASGKLAEGVFTAPVLDDLARAKGVEMPIVAGVRMVLEDKLSAGEAVKALLARPMKGE